MSYWFRFMGSYLKTNKQTNKKIPKCNCCDKGYITLFPGWCISQFHLHPGAPLGLLRGICMPCQSRGWGICKFCTARGPGIRQPRDHSRGFDTHAVSYQNITTQKVLLEKKNRLAHLSRTGIKKLNWNKLGCKGMFSILCMRFFIAFQARIA